MRLRLLAPRTVVPPNPTVAASTETCARRLGLAQRRQHALRHGVLVRNAALHPAARCGTRHSPAKRRRSSSSRQMTQRVRLLPDVEAYGGKSLCRSWLVLLLGGDAVVQAQVECPSRCGDRRWISG